MTVPKAIPSKAQKTANGHRPRRARRRTPARTPHPPHASICHGVCGALAEEHVRRDRRDGADREATTGPRATPAAATITVTGCTSGSGANSTRPAAASPPSVATSVRSRAVSPPSRARRTHRRRERRAASSVASPPSAGSTTAQSTAASAEADEGRPVASLGRNRHLRLRAEPHPAMCRQERIVRGDEDRRDRPPPPRAATRRVPPSGPGRSRAWARPARAGPARTRRRRRCRAAPARRSRDRAGCRHAANSSPNGSRPLRALTSSPPTPSATSSSAVSQTR